MNLYILPLRMKCTYIAVPDLRMIRRRLQRRINMVIVCNHNLHVHTFCTTSPIIDKWRSNYVSTSNRWQVARIIRGRELSFTRVSVISSHSNRIAYNCTQGDSKFQIIFWPSLPHIIQSYSVATLRQNRTIKIYVIDKKYVRAMITLQL